MSPKAKKQTAEERVRASAEAAKAWTLARDEAIVEMRAEGATHRAIAAAAGLTHTAVQFILKRMDA